MSEATTTAADAKPERLPDGTYEPVLTKKDLNRCGWRWCMGCLTFNYETQLAPSIVYATKDALRKIYAGDDQGYHASLDNSFKYFNATPPFSGLLLGAGLAMEDKGHTDALEAVQDLKVGLMGSLSGVGDTVCWILIPTIFGSIAAYMAQSGNPIGLFVWIAACLALFAFRVASWGIGYRFGTALITSLADKISAFTEAMSVLGLMVVGALIPTVVSIKTGLSFNMGDVALDVQEGVLDQILVGLLPVLATLGVYALLKKKVSPNLIILGIIVISWVCAALGILTA